MANGNRPTMATLMNHNQRLGEANRELQECLKDVRAERNLLVDRIGELKDKADKFDALQREYDRLLGWQDRVMQTENRERDHDEWEQIL